VNSKYYFILVGCFISSIVFCQKETKKILYDSIEKVPVDYVHIRYSAANNLGTLSNSEGYFLMSVFNNDKDSLIISHLGYPTIKVCHKDLHNVDTVFISKKAIELNEVTIYDYESLLNSVRNNLPQNYSTTPTKENYFMRYFVKQDSNKTQLIEGILTLRKNQYFGNDAGKKQEITLIANSNSINNKKNNKVEFVPFSHSMLFSYVDVLIDFNNKYEYFLEKISNTHTCISFTSIDTAIINSGPFEGYLIINERDKAMVEFYYKKKYSPETTLLKLKHGFYQEDVYFSNRRIWKKDTLNDKYKLNVMELRGEIIVTNPELNIDNSYNYNYITQKIYAQEIIPSAKPLKIKREKAINNYKERNKSLLQKFRQEVLLKTAEQSKERGK